MFSDTFIVIWNSCQLSQVINKDFISYIYSSNKSYNSLKNKIKIIIIKNTINKYINKN